MKNVFKILIFLGFTIILVGCSSKYEYLPTQKKVNIEKYKGTWYEIARFEHFFEKGCKNVKANYTLLEDGKIQVINSCTKIDTNEKKEAKGIAYATDKSNSKLKVSFFRPFYGDYWILDLDKEYNYALVGSPSREYLWILSRTKNIDESTKKALIEKAKNLKFDTEKFIWTIQD